MNKLVYTKKIPIKYSNEYSIEKLKHMNRKHPNKRINITFKGYTGNTKDMTDHLKDLENAVKIGHRHFQIHVDTNGGNVNSRDMIINKIEQLKKKHKDLNITSHIKDAKSAGIGLAFATPTRNTTKGDRKYTPPVSMDKNGELLEHGSRMYDVDGHTYGLNSTDYRTFRKVIGHQRIAKSGLKGLVKHLTLGSITDRIFHKFHDAIHKKYGTKDILIRGRGKSHRLRYFDKLNNNKFSKMVTNVLKFRRNELTPEKADKMFAKHGEERDIIVNGKDALKHKMVDRLTHSNTTEYKISDNKEHQKEFNDFVKNAKLGSQRNKIIASHLKQHMNKLMSDVGDKGEDYGKSHITTILHRLNKDIKNGMSFKKASKRFSKNLKNYTPMSSILKMNEDELKDYWNKK